MEIQITKCDLCKIEHRNDIQYHWADCISIIKLSMRDHPGLQCDWVIQVCQNCGIKIRDRIAGIINELRIKEAPNDK